MIVHYENGGHEMDEEFNGYYSYHQIVAKLEVSSVAQYIVDFKIPVCQISRDPQTSPPSSTSYPKTPSLYKIGLLTWDYETDMDPTCVDDIMNHCAEAYLLFRMTPTMGRMCERETQRRYVKDLRYHRFRNLLPKKYDYCDFCDKRLNSLSRVRLGGEIVTFPISGIGRTCPKLSCGLSMCMLPWFDFFKVYLYNYQIREITSMFSQESMLVSCLLATYRILKRFVRRWYSGWIQRRRLRKTATMCLLSSSVTSSSLYSLPSLPGDVVKYMTSFI